MKTYLTLLTFYSIECILEIQHVYQHLYNILFYNTTAELVRHVQVQYIRVYFLHMIQGKFPVDNLSKIIFQLTKILN